MDSKKISKYILEEMKSGHVDKSFAIGLLKKVNEREDIAVIGMGCSIADIQDYDQYWELLANKKMTIKRCSSNRIQLIKNQFPSWFTNDVIKYAKGTYFSDIDLFDISFFAMSEQDASSLSPGHRLVIKTAYRALEDAGYLGESNEGNKTGVFIGNNFAKDLVYSYARMELQNRAFGFRFEHMLGNWSSGLATRIAYLFNLKGGAFTLDASCPSASVAIHNACMAIRSKQCSMAIAGGMLLDLTPIKRMNNSGWVFAHGDEVISRNYDNNPGGGYCGEACGLLVLKPLKQALSDGDQIHGIICSSEFNNNGANGAFTQSSAEDISKVTISAIKSAQISAEDIDYLEGEGYPAKVEEGIELCGLIDGFRAFTENRQFCAIGSISPNFGYLQSAIGAMQLIKLFLSMKNKTIPPQCHFNEPTNMVNLIRSPFYVNAEKKNWNRNNGRPRYAAAYSYGYGGNNVFTIVQEAPIIERETPIERKELFILSAATQNSFEKYIDAYIDFLSAENECTLTDICYVASTGRILKQEYRLAVVAENKQMLRKQLIHYRQSQQETEYLACSHKEVVTKERKTARQSTKGKSLYEIAKGFCEGKVYLFMELYIGIKVNRCKLPLYPFDEISCWTKKVKKSISARTQNSENGGDNRYGKD